MFKTMLTVAALMFTTSSFALAALPSFDNPAANSSIAVGSDATPLQMLAESDNSGSGGSNSGSDDSDDSDDNDDRDDSNDNDDSDDDISGSGRDRPRTLSSGCDSAHDFVEHAECSALLKK